MTADEDREARLASALRANLRRRKAAKAPWIDVRPPGPPAAPSPASPPCEGETATRSDDPDA
jgi:hypothetical protein